MRIEVGSQLIALPIEISGIERVVEAEVEGIPWLRLAFEAFVW